MCHYFLESQPEEIRKKAEDGILEGPLFVGQGCTHKVGSDCYAYYVAEILKPGRLVALVAADSEFKKSWTDGDMACDMPADKLVRHAAAGRKVNPEFEYVAAYGGKWYWCGADEKTGELRRLRGQRAGLGWNGAYAYRDPSF